MMPRHGNPDGAVTMCMVAAVVGGACACVATADAKPQAGLASVVPADAKVEQVSTGHRFTEGPAWDYRKPGSLYFSDIPKRQIWQVDATVEMLQVFKGGYAEFKEANRMEVQEKKESTSPKKKHNSTNKQKRNEFKLRELEQHIHDKENEIHELEMKLKQQGLDPVEVGKLGETYIYLQQELDDMINRWDEYYE